MANVVLLRESKGRVVAFVALLASSSATTTSHGQSLQGWGRNNFGQTNHPATLTNVARMDCGFEHSVALRSDGTMAAWGSNFWGQCDVPAGMGTILSTAAGDLHSVAVNASGQVFCWGDNFNGQCDIPPEAVGPWQYGIILHLVRSTVAIVYSYQCVVQCELNSTTQEIL